MPAGTGSVGGPTRVSRTPHAAAPGAGRDTVPERPPAQRTGRRTARADGRRDRGDLGELALGRVVPVLHLLRPRAARPRALGRRRRAHAVLLRGRAGAQAGVRGRVAAQAGRRGGAGGRGAVRGRRTGAALHVVNVVAPERPDRRVGDPGRDRHRVRARGARRRRVAPAAGAARVPVDAGRGRRPGGDRDHRAGVHRRRARRRPAGLAGAGGGVGVPAVAAARAVAGLPGARGGGLVVHARERGARDHRRRPARAADAGTS